MAPSSPVTRGVPPRHAASLMVYRTSRGALQVLMGRRAAGARFLPNQYVFPGGAVEQGDRTVSRPVQWSGPTPTPSVLGASGRPALVRGLWHAAVREAHEETGLALQEGAGLAFVGRAITPAFSPVRFHARFFAAPLSSMRGELGGDGELVDLRWVPVEQAHTLTMIDVTSFMLQALAAQQRAQGAGWLRVTYVGEQPRRTCLGLAEDGRGP